MVSALIYLGWVLVLAFVFAKVEVNIEGATGWAGNLPTWRVERHPLLDLFWGGRPLTGYHVWVFLFMALVFHLPLFFARPFEWRLEARVLGGLMIFWIVEDFLWFVLNPAFGLRKFRKSLVPWHRHWIGPLPTDYVTFTLAGALLLWYSAT